MIATIGQSPIWLSLVAGQGFRVGESPAEVPVHPLTAVLAHHTATQSAVVLSPHGVETARAGGAEFDQVLVDPGNNSSFVLSPPGWLPWHPLPGFMALPVLLVAGWPASLACLAPRSGVV